MSIDNQIQVVLIDDDPHLRQALCQTLDLAGLKVLTLGEATGLTARLSRDWPGVVVSDIRMPGIDGLQLLDDETLISADGTHPDARGQEQIAARWSRIMAETLFHQHLEGVAFP